MRPRLGARGQSFASVPEDAVLDWVLCQRGRAIPHGMFQIRDPFGRANQFGTGRSSDISTGTAFGWSAASCEF